MTEEEKDYFKSLTLGLNTCLIMVSRGRAWIENDETSETVRMTGVTKKDADQAGIIQMMFSNLTEKKTNVKEIQQALDYFGWDLVLKEESDGRIQFDGHDRFLVVQIGWLMGTINEKEYAKLYRNAIKNNERIYF